MSEQIIFKLSAKLLPAKLGRCIFYRTYQQEGKNALQRFLPNAQVHESESNLILKRGFERGTCWGKASGAQGLLSLTSVSL